MKTKMLFAVVIFSMLALNACGGAPELDAIASEKANTSDAENSRLTADYADALTVQAQLALGTLQLEESDLAVDEDLAKELLPLWRAVQSLRNSETTADLEVKAVLNQIQDTMWPEQIDAIAQMKLTEDSMTAMLESGELGFGRGNFGDGIRRGQGEGSGFPGGGPGGGLLGGGPGGGGPGGGSGSLSEDDIATRQARFAEGGAGTLQDRVLTAAVTRLLQAKTGEAPQRVGIFDTVFTIVSDETGLSTDEIQDQIGEGATLSEIIVTNDGDVESVKLRLIEVLNELPNAEDIDAEQLAFEWLGH